MSSRLKAIRLIRLPAVKEITGLSRSSIYVRIKEGRFPAQVSFGDQAVRWVEDEVLRWAYDRVAEARKLPMQVPPAKAA